MAHPLPEEMNQIAQKRIPCAVGRAKADNKHSKKVNLKCNATCILNNFPANPNDISESDVARNLHSWGTNGRNSRPKGKCEAPLPS